MGSVRGGELGVDLEIRNLGFFIDYIKRKGFFWKVIFCVGIGFGRVLGFCF